MLPQLFHRGSAAAALRAEPPPPPPPHRLLEGGVEEPACGGGRRRRRARPRRGAEQRAHQWVSRSAPPHPLPRPVPQLLAGEVRRVRRPLPGRDAGPPQHPPLPHPAVHRGDAERVVQQQPHLAAGDDAGAGGRERAEQRPRALLPLRPLRLRPFPELVRIKRSHLLLPAQLGELRLLFGEGGVGAPVAL
eukprot:gene10536-biopygen6791